MSVSMLQPPAPTKEADAAVPRADTLSTVPTLTRVQAASVDVITFCMIYSTSQGVPATRCVAVTTSHGCRAARMQMPSKMLESPFETLIPKCYALNPKP